MFDERSCRRPVTDKLAIFRPVCRQEIAKCLVHQHDNLELHTLTDWKPMYV